MGYAVIATAIDFSTNTAYSNLIDAMTHNRVTFNINGNALEHSQFGLDYGKGVSDLKSWTAELTSRAFTAPRTGSAGQISGPGYTKFLRGWEATMTRPAKDITPMDGATNGGTFIGANAEWMYFRPLLWAAARGTMDVLVDSATNPTFPPAINNAGFSLLMTYGQDATDDSLACTAFLSELGLSASTSTAIEGRYGWLATTDVTPAGTSSVYATNLWSTYGWNQDTSGTHVFKATADDGTTLSGEAFLVGIRHRCILNELVEVTLSLQGTGPLAFA